MALSDNITIPTECDDLYTRLLDMLQVLDPLADDLKKQADSLAQEAYNFTDSVSDPLRELANDIVDRGDHVGDIVGIISSKTQSLANCISCSLQPTSEQIESKANDLLELGEDIFDLGDDGKAEVYNTTEFPTDLATTGYRIATDFVTKLRDIPETAFSATLGALGKKYGSVASILDTMDCWTNCMAEMCPDYGEHLEYIIGRVNTIRENIRIQDDGSLNKSSIVQGASETFQQYFQEVSDTINGYVDTVKTIATGGAKTLGLRTDNQITDEDGGVIDQAAGIANVRRVEWAEYGWPVGPDGDYTVSININSQTINNMFTYLSALTPQLKEYIQLYSAVLASMTLSVSGLQEKLEQDFRTTAPPVPSGSGNYPVKIDINSSVKLDRRIVEETQLYWSPIISEIDATVKGVSGKTKMPSIMRDSEFTDPAYLSLEMDQVVDTLIDLTAANVPVVTPFIEKTVNSLSHCVRQIAKNIKL